MMHLKPLWLGYGLLLLALVSCGGSSGNNPDSRDEGLLTQVSDPATLEQSIKAGFTVIQDGEEGVALALPAPGAGAQSGDFTGTYTQEANVDEFDAVRYDGTHLYVAPRRYLTCCYILPVADDGAVDTGTDPVASIRILETDPAGASASVAGTIPLEENISVQGMYLADDRMFALTAESIYGGYGEFWTDLAIWAPERLGYRVYDVSDPAAPVLEVDVSIDGVFVESRRIGNTVYIISRYSPNIDGIVYYVTTEEQRAHNETLLADVTLADLLPTITIDGEVRSLVDPQRCFIPSDEADIGYPVITTVTAVPIDNPTEFTSTCYNDEAYGAYVSQSAIYFTQVIADSQAQTSETRIHKFALAASGLNYRGSVDVNGQVWRGGQADFRMSEANGDLRVMTSSRDWVSPDFVDHFLYVLRENADRPALDIVSTLPNEQRPDEIGKPNEDLYGVRFLGDRAYAVTFERIDPLYVIDLTDPADPSIAGELAVTGFSDFLHPVGNELLLGLGRADNGGIKLELYDVSNIAQPLSRGAVVLGESGAFSEATYDRHAFTYQADVNGVDRFTIPANLLTNDGVTDGYQTALHLFEIHDKSTPQLASLLSVGAIAPTVAARPFWYTERNRAFIHDDTVFYISDEGVWAAFWNSPMLINGSF